MAPKDKPPMLDYITKMMLLELVKSTVEKNPGAALWIHTSMSDFYFRWRELDELKK